MQIVPHLLRALVIVRDHRTAVGLLPMVQDIEELPYSTHSVEYHSFSKQEGEHVSAAIVSWFAASKRKFPWRGDPPPWTRSADKPVAKGKAAKAKVSDAPAFEEVHIPWSAYGVWVSEVMSQQTRMDTVIDYYCRWMARFPTVKALAEADLEDVNAVWAG